ncbi:MAG: tetratricopeptide repeat protein, partial [Chloroflexota bacterium]
MIPLFAIAIVIALFGYFVLRVRFHDQASTYYNSAEYDRALSVYNRLVRFYPRDAAAYRNRALVQMQRGQPDAALADFNAAIERSPRDIGLRMERATLYTQLKRFEEADVEYERLTQISPQNPQVYLNRAWYYIKADNLDAALQNIDRAEAHIVTLHDKRDEFGPRMKEAEINQFLTQQTIQALSLKAAVFTRKGRFEEAVDTYQAAIEQAPHDATLYNDLAETYIAAEAYDRALALFDQAESHLTRGGEAPPQTMSGQTMQQFIIAGRAVAKF